MLVNSQIELPPDGQKAGGIIAALAKCPDIHPHVHFFTIPVCALDGIYLPNLEKLLLNLPGLQELTVGGLGSSSELLNPALLLGKLVPCLGGLKRLCLVKTHGATATETKDLLERSLLEKSEFEEFLHNVSEPGKPGRLTLPIEELKVDQESFETIAAVGMKVKFSNLQALTIRGYDALEGDESSVCEFLDHVAETLETLTIHGKRGCDLSPLSKLKKLEKLTYIRDPLPDRLPLELREALEQSPNLRELELAWNGSEIDDATRAEIQKINPHLIVRCLNFHTASKQPAAPW
jgi:hypothetical protein